MKILLSDYYATGEGRTICLLITMSGHAEVEFEELFPYYADYVTEYSIEQLLDSYDYVVPTFLKELLLDGDCYLHYHQEFHYNYA